MRIESVATFLIGLVAGILFRSFADFGGALPVFLLSLSLFLSFFGEGIFGRLTAVFLLAAAVGIFRYDLVDTRDSLHLSQYENRNVSAEALLTDEPKINDKSATLYASVAVSGGQRFNALILTTPYVAYHYGDRLSIYGQLEQVKNFSDSFDYQAYLGKDEIYYQFFQPKITLLSSGNGSYLQEKLFEFKDRFLAHINALISEPESSLLSGIVLGAKSSLDPLLTQAFTRAGLIHIVALSGYNVTVVADAFTKMTWFLPVSLRLSAGAIGIILFTLMTGGSTTAVRAAVMGLLSILARATGKGVAARPALFAAAGLIIS